MRSIVRMSIAVLRALGGHLLVVVVLMAVAIVVLLTMVVMLARKRFANPLIDYTYKLPINRSSSRI